MKCRLCSENILEAVFSANLLGRTVLYFDCSTCGYLQTEQPTWLKEAYATSMNDTDTGVMSRNVAYASLTLATLALIRETKSQIVDYAGGHGFLVRLLRDIGIDAFWSDPYATNLVAKGFEYSDKEKANIKLVTIFEAFEHFTDPLKEIEKIFSIAPNILLSTSIAPFPAPQPADWWYYGLEHGQHVGFFRLKTLNYLAHKFNFYLISDEKSVHFFSKKKHSTYIWKFFGILAYRFTKLFSFAIGLKSKVWTDHLQIKSLK
jgi:hypothetical protein